MSRIHFDEKQSYHRPIISTVIQQISRSATHLQIVTTFKQDRF